MKPADVRKTLATEIRFDMLPVAVQEALIERSPSQIQPASANVVEALTAYLAWEGIIGYTDHIVALFKAALNATQLEGSPNEQRAVICNPDPATVVYALAGRSPPEDPGACTYCHRSPGAQCWDEPNCSAGNRAGRRCLNTVFCDHPECDCYARNE